MSCESWIINSLKKLQRLSNFIRYIYFALIFYLKLLSLLRNHLSPKQTKVIKQALLCSKPSGDSSGSSFFCSVFHFFF